MSVKKDLSYKGVFNTLLSSHNNKLVRSLKRRKLSSMLDVMSERKAKGMITKGWRRLVTIRKCLDGFKGFERTKMQKRFHHAFLQATAMHLFRDDVDVDLAKVMHINGWSHLKQQCLCMTPRRFGVSTTLFRSFTNFSNTTKENNVCRHVLCRLLILGRKLRDRHFQYRTACKYIFIQ